MVEWRVLIFVWEDEWGGIAADYRVVIGLRWKYAWSQRNGSKLAFGKWMTQAHTNVLFLSHTPPTHTHIHTHAHTHIHAHTYTLTHTYTHMHPPPHIPSRLGKWSPSLLGSFCPAVSPSGSAPPPALPRRPSLTKWLSDLRSAICKVNRCGPLWMDCRHTSCVPLFQPSPRRLRTEQAVWQSLPVLKRCFWLLSC